MLSVFERTHEIGLLRAIGMRRRQIRAMIRSESVILAIFGVIIGMVIGTGLGVAVVSSLPIARDHRHRRARVEPRRLPARSPPCWAWSRPSWPARRAAKLDVLSAIASD